MKKKNYNYDYKRAIVIFSSVPWLLIGHTTALTEKNLLYYIINNQSEIKKRMKILMIVQLWS